MKWLGVIAFSLLSLTLHCQAKAASFDCSKAGLPREKLVCAKPELSSLDDQLGRLYQEKRGQLSAHGALLLQRSQQGWLRAITSICSAQAHLSADAEVCLEGWYKKRLHQLSHVAEKMGPFIFNRIDLFATPTIPAADGKVPSLSTIHVGYPQIDNADTPASQDWNRQAEREIAVDNSDCEGGGDDDQDYEIGYATAKMISINWTQYTYCYGTPHGLSEQTISNVVFLPKHHELEASELFGSDESWSPKLQDMFEEVLKAGGWVPQNDDAEQEIMSAVIAPERWFFTSEGLEARFEPYEGGCYACTPRVRALISWEKLRPLIVSGAPLP